MLSALSEGLISSLQMAVYSLSSDAMMAMSDLDSFFDLKLQINASTYHSIHKELVSEDDKIVKCSVCDHDMIPFDWNIVWVPTRNRNYYCCSGRCMRRM